jgi:hypothetical protein
MVVIPAVVLAAKAYAMMPLASVSWIAIPVAAIEFVAMIPTAVEPAVALAPRVSVIMTVSVLWIVIPVVERVSVDRILMVVEPVVVLAVRAVAMMPVVSVSSVFPIALVSVVITMAVVKFVLIIVSTTSRHVIFKPVCVRVSVSLIVMAKNVVPMVVEGPVIRVVVLMTYVHLQDNVIPVSLTAAGKAEIAVPPTMVVALPVKSVETNVPTDGTVMSMSVRSVISPDIVAQSVLPVLS